MNLQRSFIFVTFLALSAILFAQENDVYVSGDSLIQQGIALHDEGKHEEALSCYSKVNPNDENYPWSLYEKALTYSAMNQEEETVRLLKSMQEYPNSLDLNYYNLLGNTLDDLNQREKAKEVFESVYSRYGHTWLIPFNYALVCYKDGELDKARTILEKTVRINPYHFNSQMILGKIHYAQGRLAPALLCFAYAATIAENNQLANRAFNYFDQALNGTLKETIESESSAKVSDDSADDELNQQFKELEFMIKSYLAGNKKFVVKAKIDYATTRQLQFLIENIKADSGKEDVFNQLYIPFFNQLVQANHIEPCLYFFVRFSDNEDIVKQLNKNKSSIQKYLDWATKSINDGREKLFNPQSISYYTFNRLGIESEGSYSDYQKKVKTGDWIFYQDNGEKASEGSFTDNKREGAWTFYDKKGNVGTKENYKNDLAEGELIGYKNGIISRKSNYKDGKQEGEDLYFNQSGFLKNKMFMKDDKADGLYTAYYDNQNIYYTINYVDGASDGAYTVFYANNTPKRTGFFKDNKLDGTTTACYSNGEKSDVENYKNEIRTGVQQSWYPNGKLQKDFTTNEEGEITGIYKEYHSNGQLSDSVMYTKGIAQGTGYFYDRDGKLHYTISYDNNGKRNICTFYDKSGEVTGVSKMVNNKIDYRFLDPNGKVLSKGLFVDNQPEGIWEFYDSFGNLTTQQNHKNGDLDGEALTFYAPTGKIGSRSFYKEGKLNGRYIQYYPDGNMKTGGYFLNGEKEGEWKSFYLNGQVSAVNFYSEGEYRGLQNYYTFEGKKSRDEFYENGFMTRIAYYDEKEEVYGACEFDNGYGTLLIKHPDGKIYYECPSVKGGKYNGELKIYNIKGNVVQQNSFVDGMIDGKKITFNDDNEKIDETDFILGEIHGKSKQYQNGKLIFELDCISGIPVGRTDYHQNGKKSYECSYDDSGERNGWAFFYDESGELQYGFLYEKGMQTGYCYLDENGDKIEKNFDKGPQKITAYYQNGNKSLEATITNGWREGSYTKWHANGKLESESNYVNNEQTGEYKKYSKEGILVEHRFFQYGDLHGLSKEYSDKGILLSEEEYMNGDLHGTCKYYHANGQPRCTRIYYNGRLVSEI